MKIRTLISNQLYFGLEPLDLRRGTERTLSRVFGLPPDRVRVTRETLREDFRLDMAESEALVRASSATDCCRPTLRPPATTG
jgi:hypothetical protein